MAGPEARNEVSVLGAGRQPRQQSSEQQQAERPGEGALEPVIWQRSCLPVWRCPIDMGCTQGK